MGTAPHVSDSPVFLDAANQCLRRNGQSIPLTPKAFVVLRHLAERPSQLVTKEELLNAAWPETYVSDAALKVCISRLRQALGDLSHPPKYIETVHWRGYRLLIPIPTAPPPVVSSQHSGVGIQQEENQNAKVKEQYSTSTPQHLLPHTQDPAFSVQHSVSPTFPVVGRESELQQLYEWLEKARSGERHIAFISGVSGVGKTTLVETFLAQFSNDSRITIAKGQCVEHYGAGESYLPVLEAIQRACRAPGGEQLMAALRRSASLWMAQLPSLLSPAECRQLRQETQHSSRERMLREMAEAVEAFTAERTLILVLEDLHWSDYATLNLLCFLAKRLEPARLFLLGVYRPEESPEGGRLLKSIKHELQVHNHCNELVLAPFSLPLIDRYVRERFPEHVFPPTFVTLLHKRTGGNPLFLANILDHLVKCKSIVQYAQSWRLTSTLEHIETETPQSLQQIIAAQIDRLTVEEKRVLEAASVAGMDFSAAAVAAGLGVEAVDVEMLCEELARHEQFLRSQGSGEWPDGTVATRYEFLHSLYRQVWYERVTAARRVQLHQRIGLRGEQAYQDQAQKIAAELAVHFEQARDIPRAVRYREYAAENATRRFGYHEAITHLTCGLTLLSSQPTSQAGLMQEIRLQNMLGAARIALLGYAAPEVEEAYTRARNLCWQVGVKAESVPALRGLWAFYLTKGEFQLASSLATQLFQVAQQEHRRDLQMEAERELGQTYYFLGELREACLHLERGISLYDPQQHTAHIFLYGQDPGVVCLSHSARALFLFGYEGRALAQSDAALSLAQQIGHPYSLALAYYHAAVLHFARRDWQRAHEFVQTTLALSTEHEFPYWLFSAQVLDGWLLTLQGRMEEGIARMQQGLASYKAIGAELNRPYSLLFLAEAYGRAGHPAEGLVLLTEALATAQKNGGHFRQADMWRLQGELTLQKAGVGGWGLGVRLPSPQGSLPKSQAPSEAMHEAEQYFMRAIELLIDRKRNC